MQPETTVCIAGCIHLLRTGFYSLRSKRPTVEPRIPGLIQNQPADRYNLMLILLQRLHAPSNNCARLARRDLMVC
jgi:hypothetical protein